MNKILELECNLKKLNEFAVKIAQKTIIGDIFFLKGDLGAGKTTFSRLLINSLFEKEKILKPKIIKSPTFPIVINYPYKNVNIYHYDLYRLKKKEELTNIELFENLENNITVIEWPDLVIKNYTLKKFYLIDFKIINFSKRQVHMYHSIKNNINE